MGKKLSFASMAVALVIAHLALAGCAAAEEPLVAFEYNKSLKPKGKDYAILSSKKEDAMIFKVLRDIIQLREEGSDFSASGSQRSNPLAEGPIPLTTFHNRTKTDVAVLFKTIVKYAKTKNSKTAIKDPKLFWGMIDFANTYCLCGAELRTFNKNLLANGVLKNFNVKIMIDYLLKSETRRVCRQAPSPAGKEHSITSGSPDTLKVVADALKSKEPVDPAEDEPASEDPAAKPVYSISSARLNYIKMLICELVDLESRPSRIFKDTLVVGPRESLTYSALIEMWLYLRPEDKDERSNSLEMNYNEKFFRSVELHYSPQEILKLSDPNAYAMLALIGLIPDGDHIISFAYGKSSSDDFKEAYELLNRNDGFAGISSFTKKSCFMHDEVEAFKNRIYYMEAECEFLKTQDGEDLKRFEKFLSFVHAVAPKEAIVTIKDLAHSKWDEIFEAFPKIRGLILHGDDRTLDESNWAKLKNTQIEKITLVNAEFSKMKALATGTLPHMHFLKTLQIRYHDYDKDVLAAIVGLPLNLLAINFETSQSERGDPGKAERVRLEREAFLKGILQSGTIKNLVITTVDSDLHEVKEKITEIMGGVETIAISKIVLVTEGEPAIFIKS